MTTIAPNADKLREIDEDTRRAWTAYSDSLRELAGEEYELAERESWTRLQTELKGLERRRRVLASESD